MNVTLTLLYRCVALLKQLCSSLVRALQVSTLIGWSVQREGEFLFTFCSKQSSVDGGRDDKEEEEEGEEGETEASHPSVWRKRRQSPNGEMTG